MLETDAAPVAAKRYARNRFMRLSSAALFGFSASLFLPRYAEAHCPPNGKHPCYGLPLCGTDNAGCENREARCCSSTQNYCTAECDHNVVTCDAQGTQYNCWVTCHEGHTYRCCDCRQGDGDFCICRFRTGTC